MALGRLGILTALTRATATITSTGEEDMKISELFTICGYTYCFGHAGSFDTSSILFTSQDATANLGTLVKAINDTGTADEDYLAAHPGIPNPFCSAAQAADVVTLTSRTAGEIGNLLAITESTTGCSLSGATFSGGTGHIWTAINEMQAACQLNAELIALLAYLETGE